MSRWKKRDVVSRLDYWEGEVLLDDPLPRRSEFLGGSSAVSEFDAPDSPDTAFYADPRRRHLVTGPAERHIIDDTPDPCPYLRRR